MLHRRRDVPGGLGVSLGLRVGGPLLQGGGGALPTLFDWNPETAQALPGTSTFTRATVKQTKTITTVAGGIWYQEAQSGELPFEGLRRVENFIDVPLSGFNEVSGASFSDPQLDLSSDQFSRMERSVNTGQFVSGGTFCVSARVRRVGGSDLGFRLKNGHAGVQSYFSTDFIATSDYQVFSFTQKFDVVGSGSTVDAAVVNESAGGVKSLDIDWIQLEKVQDDGDTFGGLVEFGVIYNANVAGVRYFDTDNGNSGFDPVIEATGTTITDGGSNPNPAATNRLENSNDMTQASWTATGAATPTNLGITDIGAQTTRVSGIGAQGVDDISQSVAGFAASATVSPSLSIQRVSTSGVLRIINATGAANGEWQVDLSLIGADWVQLQDVGSTAPIVTFGSPVSRVADSLTDTSWQAEGAAVVDVTVAGVTIPGFSEVTPWVADGGGNAGVLFHALSGGPLTVDIAFNQLENSSGVEMRMLGFGDNTAYSFRLDLPTVARIATGGINSFIVAASSYEGERHGFGMSFQLNEGIVVDDEDNDNTDVTGTPGGGTIYISLNSALAGVPGRYHRVRIAPVTQTVDELKDLV